ncbi:MAG: carbohydrate kinase family protein [Galactobacter sp.]
MFLVVGEAVLDVVAGGVEPPSSHVGGSPLNVAVGLARLGLPVTLVTRYGTDPAGDQVHALLQAEGIAEVVPRDQLPTSAAHGVLDPAGAADYDFDQVEWDLSGFVGESAHRVVEAAHVLHVGSLASLLEPGAETVQRIVEDARPHASVSFDPNVRPRLTPDRAVARENVERYVRLADVVRASESDLSWLYPDRRAERTATEWLEMGPALVVVSSGSGEIVGYTRQGVARVPAIEVDVEDSVGAGDAASSALLAALEERGLLGADRREQLKGISVATVREVLDFSARAAAISVARSGPNPPTREELDAR